MRVRTESIGYNYVSSITFNVFKIFITWGRSWRSCFVFVPAIGLDWQKNTLSHCLSVSVSKNSIDWIFCCFYDIIFINIFREKKLNETETRLGRRQMFSFLHEVSSNFPIALRIFHGWIAKHRLKLEMDMIYHCLSLSFHLLLIPSIKINWNCGTWISV